MSEGTLWLLILGMGLITYGLRLALILMWEYVEVPALARQALHFVPPAVLTAIILPELFRSGDPMVLPFASVRLVAGVLAALVAWRTRNVLLTIAVGMGVLWLLQAMVH